MKSGGIMASSQKKKKKLRRKNQIKKQIKNPDLQTWINLNNALRDADEAVCQQLMEEEKAGRRRRQFIRRIHCRLNKVRADRERDELGVT